MPLIDQFAAQKPDNNAIENFSGGVSKGAALAAAYYDNQLKMQQFEQERQNKRDELESKKGSYMKDLFEKMVNADTPSKRKFYIGALRTAYPTITGREMTKQEMSNLGYSLNEQGNLQKLGQVNQTLKEQDPKKAMAFYAKYLQEHSGDPKDLEQNLNNAYSEFEKQQQEEQQKQSYKPESELDLAGKYKDLKMNPVSKQAYINGIKKKMWEDDGGAFDSSGNPVGESNTYDSFTDEKFTDKAIERSNKLIQGEPNPYQGRRLSLEENKFVESMHKKYSDSIDSKEVQTIRKNLDDLKTKVNAAIDYKKGFINVKMLKELQYSMARATEGAIRLTGNQQDEQMLKDLQTRIDNSLSSITGKEFVPLTSNVASQILSQLETFGRETSSRVNNAVDRAATPASSFYQGIGQEKSNDFYNLVNKSKTEWKPILNKPNLPLLIKSGKDMESINAMLKASGGPQMSEEQYIKIKNMVMSGAIK